MSRPIIKLQPGRQSMAFCSTHVPVRLPPCRTGECSAPCKPPRTTGTPGQVPARYIHGLARWTLARGRSEGPISLGPSPPDDRFTSQGQSALSTRVPLAGWRPGALTPHCPCHAQEFGAVRRIALVLDRRFALLCSCHRSFQAWV